MRPYIGIPCGTTRNPEWSPALHGHRETYISAVVAAGGVPLLLPLVDDEDVLRASYDLIDGLLLAGGGDVEPHHYGEEPIPELGAVDPLRDRVELWLARRAAAEAKPILAICRGIQVLNVALGGSLYQDIAAQLRSEVVHNSSAIKQDWSYMAHELRLEPGSQLAQLLGVERLPVNSLHHQAVKAVAPGLQAVGWSPDGVVEALESTGGRFIIGVQCHPEALQAEADVRWRSLFGRFVEACTTRVR